MDRSAAAAIAAEACDLAVEGNFPELLQLELPGEVLELVRQKAQINSQIQNLESQETILWELLVSMLIDYNTTLTEVRQ